MRNTAASQPQKTVDCGYILRILRSMSETSEVARRLKMLRERAGLSMRAVSEALGWTLTRYQHYEDRYRRAYLPLDLARQLADTFAPRGIPAADVLALAGVDSGLPSLPASAVAPM